MRSARDASMAMAASGRSMSRAWTAVPLDHQAADAARLGDDGGRARGRTEHGQLPDMVALTVASEHTGFRRPGHGRPAQRPRR